MLQHDVLAVGLVEQASQPVFILGLTVCLWLTVRGSPFAVVPRYSLGFEVALRASLPDSVEIAELVVVARNNQMHESFTIWGAKASTMVTQRSGS